MVQHTNSSARHVVDVVKVAISILKVEGEDGVRVKSEQKKEESLNIPLNFHAGLPGRSSRLLKTGHKIIFLCLQEQKSEGAVPPKVLLKVKLFS